uniref:phosphotransferase n=1 Tax=Streptomyces aureocirculatus TaxID=67275 RepID=UPI0004CD95CF
MQTGGLLGSGRSADVFAIDDHWVLRRYRDGGDVTAEAAVMAYLAEHGYPITTEEAGAGLADLLHRLHSVPARVSADPVNRILHLDLHPDNVMLTSGRPVVIDWRNTEEGPPGLDWAMSALILAQVAVGNT